MSSPIRPTVFIESSRLSAMLGTQVILASETFQVTGSFKFRAAYILASSVPNNHIITASSGNFGQALARACQLLAKHCTVVMPRTSAEVKIQSVSYYGGKVKLIDTQTISRSKAVAQLAELYPQAYVASAYDDPFVIAGNASLGRELAQLKPLPNYIIVPVGGGGLSGGIITGLKEAGASVQVVGAEPLTANDAAKSLRTGVLTVNQSEPQTIADGARTLSLGKLNWPILQSGMSFVAEVPEEQIREGVRFLFHYANLKAEPTGALSIGAVLHHQALFRGQRVCCVISGGNVDSQTYMKLLDPVT